MAGSMLPGEAQGPDSRQLLEALLQLTPAVQQALAGLEALWQTERASAAREGGVGSYPDACYMWRRGGALDLLRRHGGAEG